MATTNHYRHHWIRKWLENGAFSERVVLRLTVAMMWFFSLSFHRSNDLLGNHARQWMRDAFDVLFRLIFTSSLSTECWPSIAICAETYKKAHFYSHDGAHLCLKIGGSKRNLTPLHVSTVGTLFYQCKRNILLHTKQSADNS